MISGMGELAYLLGQPQIGVEGHEIRDRTDELGINLAEIGQTGVAVEIERKLLAKIRIGRGKGNLLIFRNQI